MACRTSKWIGTSQLKWNQNETHLFPSLLSSHFLFLCSFFCWELQWRTAGRRHSKIEIPRWFLLWNSHFFLSSLSFFFSSYFINFSLKSFLSFLFVLALDFFISENLGTHNLNSTDQIHFKCIWIVEFKFWVLFGYRVWVVAVLLLFSLYFCHRLKELIFKTARVSTTGMFLLILKVMMKLIIFTKQA